MPLQSSVPFLVITGIITVVGGIVPVAHYIITGEVRARSLCFGAPALC